MTLPDLSAMTSEQKHCLRKYIRRYKKRKLVVEMLGNRCADCGMTDSHISFFDLHHVDPNHKDIKISEVLKLGWKRIYEEIQKCVLLCPSCHRKRHIELGDFTDQEYYEKIIDSGI